MTTAKAFDSILQQIQNSNLNFKLQLSPVAEQQPPVHDMPQFSPGLYIQYRE